MTYSNSLLSAAVALLIGVASAHAAGTTTETTSGSASNAERWCTNDRSLVDTTHVYDASCPAASARMGADGKWQAMSSGPVDSSGSTSSKGSYTGGTTGTMDPPGGSGGSSTGGGTTP